MISLTFDDALDQHLDVVLPILDEAQLHGTFYAHLSAPSLNRRIDEWKSLAQSGHEIGNHTIFHPADARKSWVSEGNALDLYSIDRMEMELQLANKWLTVIDGQTQRTFAYPCSNTVLGSYGKINQFLFRAGLPNTRGPRLGGYDEGFVGWGGEDNEFFDRCKHIGHLTFGYVPFTHLWHAPQSDKHIDDNKNITRVLEARVSIPTAERIAELTQRKFGSATLPDPSSGYRDTIVATAER